MSEDDTFAGGTRVRVCYSDGFWYYGSIDDFHEPTGKYRISLDEGDRIFVALPDVDVEILEAGAVGMRKGTQPVRAGRSGNFKHRRVPHQVERYMPGEEMHVHNKPHTHAKKVEQTVHKSPSSVPQRSTRGGHHSHGKAEPVQMEVDDSKQSKIRKKLGITEELSLEDVKSKQTGPVQTGRGGRSKQSVSATDAENNDKPAKPKENSQALPEGQGSSLSTEAAHKDLVHRSKKRRSGPLLSHSKNRKKKNKLEPKSPSMTSVNPPRSSLPAPLSLAHQVKSTPEPPEPAPPAAPLTEGKKESGKSEDSMPKGSRGKKKAKGAADAQEVPPPAADELPPKSREVKGESKSKEKEEQKVEERAEKMAVVKTEEEPSSSTSDANKAAGSVPAKRESASQRSANEAKRARGADVKSPKGSEGKGLTPAEDKGLVATEDKGGSSTEVKTPRGSERRGGASAEGKKGSDRKGSQGGEVKGEATADPLTPRGAEGKRGSSSEPKTPKGLEGKGGGSEGKGGGRTEGKGCNAAEGKEGSSAEGRVGGSMEGKGGSRAESKGAKDTVKDAMEAAGGKVEAGQEESNGRVWVPMKKFLSESGASECPGRSVRCWKDSRWIRGKVVRREEGAGGKGAKADLKLLLEDGEELEVDASDAVEVLAGSLQDQGKPESERKASRSKVAKGKRKGAKCEAKEKAADAGEAVAGDEKPADVSGIQEGEADKASSKTSEGDGGSKGAAPAPANLTNAASGTSTPVPARETRPNRRSQSVDSNKETVKEKESARGAREEKLDSPRMEGSSNLTQEGRGDKAKGESQVGSEGKKGQQEGQQRASKQAKIRETRSSTTPARTFQHAIGQRLRVLYDDGWWYPGAITGREFIEREKGKQPEETYHITLDDGETQLSSTLPDPDIQLIEGDKDASEPVKNTTAEGAEVAAVEDKGYIGVRKRDRYWLAEIKRQGQTIKLGQYDNAEDAAKAYDEAAIRYQGEKAKVNFQGSKEIANTLSNPLRYINSRVRVLYDDGIWYEGAILSYDDKSNEFSIRLDDDTRFTTTLPDPDIEIMPSALSPKAVASSCLSRCIRNLPLTPLAASSSHHHSISTGSGRGKSAAQPAIQYANGMRLRVLYDDGAFYPGTIIGCNEQDKRYKIKLDEGTKFSTALPDPDIEVLGMAPPSVKFWNLKKVANPDVTSLPDKIIKKEPPMLELTHPAQRPKVARPVVFPVVVSHKWQVNYQGVEFEDASGAWAAKIQLQDSIKFLGIYDTPEEAAAAYNAAVRHYRSVMASLDDQDRHLQDMAESWTLNPVIPG